MKGEVLPFDTKTLRALVERRHPEYGAMANHWAFLESCYRGGRDWFVCNIFQYFKEGANEYKCRVERAYRFNHTREVVDLVNKYLFRAEIQRKTQDAPPSVQKFWKRATRQGHDIGEFMRMVSTKGSVLGRPWVIVDNANRVNVENLSKAEEPQNSIYAYLVSPQDVLDLSWGEDGRLNWILIRELHRDDEDPFDSDGCVEEKYRLWTRTSWYLIAPQRKRRGGVTYVVEDEGKHDLGEVPAVNADNIITADPWSAPALIADIAYLDRAAANYASNLDAIIQDQTFSQLVMPAQNVLPGEDAYNKLLEIGTNRMFLFDGESGIMPAYISPDPRQATLIVSVTQTIISEIYHCVGLAGERTKQDSAKGIDNSSGVAKDKDFDRVVALLAAKADSLEIIESRINRLVALWAGERMPEHEIVSYPERFDVTGLWDEFDVAMRLAAVEAPAALRAQHMDVLVEKLFPSLSQEVIDKLKKDVAAWGMELKETSDLQRQLESNKASLMGEARRNRGASGETQSATKSRETGKSSGRETGQEQKA